MHTWVVSSTCTSRHARTHARTHTHTHTHTHARTPLIHLERQGNKHRQRETEKESKLKPGVLYKICFAP